MTTPTKRQVHVLELRAAGFKRSEVAVALGISENTVQAHMAALYRGTGAKSTANLVAIGMREGYIR